MWREFFTGLFEGPKQYPQLNPVVPALRRPTRKQMKKHLEKAVVEATQYRFKFFVHGREYHAVYAYVRGAIYTLTYEFVGKRRSRRFPKLVSHHSGKPGPRELAESVHFAVKERQRRIDRALTLGK